MTRITQLFQQKKNNILSIYFTAGYPALNDTVSTIETLQEAGVDLIEIGIPYSDPLADGPVIQNSSMQAICNGMTLKMLFEQLKDIRKTVNIPLIMMGYLNPILQFGIENFCKACKETGIDGLIIPDLPMVEYLTEYKTLFSTYGLSNVFLITPQSSNDRVKQIDMETNGFIYMVSSAATTGKNTQITTSQPYFDRIKSLQLKSPTVIGFGIRDHASFTAACEYANGAIIGTAFIKAVANAKNLSATIHEFIKQIRQA